MNRRHDDNDETQVFARVLSHDLGTLIRTARHLSGYVREDILRGDADSAMHAIGMLDLRLANLDRFVAELIRFYRAGQRAMTLEQFSVSAIVKSVFQKGGFPASAELRLSASHDLVLTDQVMLRTVLKELFENAFVHHPEPAELTIDVDVSQTPDSRTIVIVRDNGLGLRSLDSKSVFQPFVKNSPRANSVGLGLAICKRELAAVGGEICIQPVKKGLAVALILPTVADLPSQQDRPRIERIDDNDDAPNLRIV
ncbi:MAG: sensor histidine kinase [Woeseiaceae bacterium]